MDGETMRKEMMNGGNGAQEYEKHPTGYQNHSQHIQRSPSMDTTNRHHHRHNQQQFAKPLHPTQRHPEQQYHGKAPSHYPRRYDNRGGYPAYPPPAQMMNQNHMNHYHPHYSPRSRSHTPRVQTVVSHSFSMEEEQREDGSSRYCGGHHHRSPNQRDTSSYPGDEYRSPSGEFSADRSSHQHQQRDAQDHSFQPPPPLPPHHYGSRRDYQYVNDRELPPVLEESRIQMSPGGMISRTGDQVVSKREPPSPPVEGQAPGIERSLSSVSTGGPLKRSFWHHSRPVDAMNGNDVSMPASSSPSLPSEFLPPKRSKTGESKSPGSPKREKEYTMTPRSQASPNSDREHQQEHEHEQQIMDIPGGNGGLGSLGGGIPTSTSDIGLSPSGDWYTNRARSMSWEAREDYYRRDPRSAPSWSSRSPSGRDGPAPVNSGSGSHWMEAPYMPSPRGRHTRDGSHYDMHLQPWEASPRDWGHHAHHLPHHPHQPPHLQYLAWPGRSNGNGREESEEGKKFRGHEHGAFDSEQKQSHLHFPVRGAPPLLPQPHGMGHIMGPPMQTGSGGVDPSIMMEGQSGDMMNSDRRGVDKSGPIKLLALPEDRISLSETLCIVRENVEVFTATIEDVEAPAPGRKHAVTVGQVGLRCIHCRHTTRSSERVKRAVCYPSSIKRIYRTVIDMKLDHFLHCKFVPQPLKDTLQALKANNTRSTGTTMQYFIRAATSLGMVDGPMGVRIADSSIPTVPMSLQSSGKNKLPKPSSLPTKGKEHVPSKINSKNPGEQSESSSGRDIRINRTSSSMSTEGTPQTSVSTDDLPSELFTGKVALSVPEDKMSLSPLRCFLREQVCAFSATEEDIAVRTPTTFAVSVGQVGIGCIHCLGQPAKLRLNRAVCFPFSITRIYQSVADIQRFHLGECKMVPKDVKEKFLELQSQSSKGSKGLATRQYWVTSAKKIGLVDTTKGIRFCRDPAIPENKPVSLDILAQVASNVTTVNKPLVLPEDKPQIAEFLFVVMGQLQPCRFTEADRNKRRLKDVGCIGVECKHCAGQVDGRKFFWSSVNAVESNFVSVHTHMMECRMVPEETKEELARLKKLRKEQTAALKTGSQKSFFARVWKRLHEEPKKDEPKDEQKDGEQQDSTTKEGCSERAAEAPIEKTAAASEKATATTDSTAKASFSVSLSQDTLDLAMTTPTTSPASVEKPFTEISVGKLSPGSPDSTQKIEAVSDKMAVVRV
ncbi:unnamed protein product [Pseudo-nitzschia multistriata]|uniref:Uncharacterized protein n=1 Tax=Pseudo-nitzschia multistriata TaxID=183589 RepID=A0A448ZRQ5_9STRA|nr:unnamed protein product [Pseudo-nitzschia multistriata]